MSKFAVLVEVFKVAGKAYRWIRVDAESQSVAIKLAQNAAKSGPKVVKAIATAVRSVK